jgi:uncharacterized integral membrane protein
MKYFLMGIMISATASRIAEYLSNTNEQKYWIIWVVVVFILLFIFFFLP